MVYALAQTCIKNFRDVLEGAFHERLEDEIDWKLLPLGINPPVDVVTYLGGGQPSEGSRARAVTEFLAELSKASDELTATGVDPGRLLTVFNVRLESVKSIADADVNVGLDASQDTGASLILGRRLDPNVTHPLREKDLLAGFDQLHPKFKNQFVFRAIVWKHQLKENPQYAWEDAEVSLTKYSRDVPVFVKRMSTREVAQAVADYRQQRKRGK